MMTKKLKALLLCAGFGTRLRPITLKDPKCLMQISGKPLLGLWLKKLEQYGFQEVLINTHYLSEKVNEYLKKRPENNRIKINTIYEEKLLGTAGTLMQNKYFFKDSTGFLIHGDNLTNFNLLELFNAHKKRRSNCLLTMLTFNSKNPRQCGIVETDENGILKGFHEKVENPPSNRANAAVYAFDYELFEFLSSLSNQKVDFSKDIIPKLLGRIQTYHTNDFFIDIGTKEALEEANKVWGEINE